MGFYGNITSATKTGFSFDRIYPNRRAMEVNTKSDNVYIGRYVLVDYDSTDENIPFVYKKDSTCAYADNTQTYDAEYEYCIIP